jgi:hypothetical protein
MGYDTQYRLNTQTDNNNIITGLESSALQHAVGVLVRPRIKDMFIV